MAVVRFGDVVKEVKNKVDRNNNPYEYYIAGDHMDSEDLHLHRKGSFATNDVGPAFIREFLPGQILYGSRRTYLKKVAVADFSGVTANTTFVLETKNEEVLRQRLIPFIMLSEAFTEWSISKSKGSTNPYVLFSDLAGFEFELPSIEEQDKLVDLLWSMDAAVVSYKEAIAKTDELVKSQFIELFGDPGNNPKGWTESTLKDICLGKLSYGSGAAATDYDGETRYIRITDITDEGELNDDVKSPSTIDEKYLLKDGDILFARSGATVGKVLRYKEQYGRSIYAGFLIRLVPNTEKVIPDYVFGFTRTPFYEEFVRRTQRAVGQPNINAQEYGNLKICIPPMELQNQFAEFLKQSDKSKFALKDTMKSVEAMMTKIVTNSFKIDREEG